jgi:hypothetical protein
MRTPGDEKDHRRGETHAMTSNDTWTAETIRALGPTTDMQTLAGIIGCGTWKACKMARQGEWEQIGIKVIPIGARYRVVVQSILDVLGFASGDSATCGTEQPDETAEPDETAGAHEIAQPGENPAGSTARGTPEPVSAGSWR